MVRNLVAIFTGIIFGGLIVALVHTIGHFFYPPPEGIDLSKPDALAKIIDQLPMGALLFVLAAWIAGSFSGTGLAKLIAGNSPYPALFVGFMMWVFVAYNLYIIPHPSWMMVAGLILPVPSAWLGIKLVRK